MTFWLIMVPTLALGHPHATKPRWLKTHAQCVQVERQNNLPPGSCLRTTGGQLPDPSISLDSDGDNQ